MLGKEKARAQGFEMNLSFAKHTRILKYTASILPVDAKSLGKRDSMRPCFNEIDSLPLPIPGYEDSRARKHATGSTCVYKDSEMSAARLRRCYHVKGAIYLQSGRKRYMKNFFRPWGGGGQYMYVQFDTYTYVVWRSENGRVVTCISATSLIFHLKLITVLIKSWI